MKIDLNPSFGDGDIFFYQQNREGNDLFSLSKKHHSRNLPSKGLLTKVIRLYIMVLLLLWTGLFQVSAYTFGQQITLHKKGSNLESILKEVEKQSGYSFFYKKAEVAPVKNISVDIKDMPLSQALDNILEKVDFTYNIFGNTVVLKKAPLPAYSVRMKGTEAAPRIAMALAQQYVRGQVLDENDNPVTGASVRVKSNVKNTVVTDENGAFTMPLTVLNEILVISYIGYEAREIKASLNPDQMIVRLKSMPEEVEEVVVTGMMDFDKETFSGATARYSGEELRMVTNSNVIQSLRSLDPSFLLMENNSTGSNPNTLPTIELRGQSSISTESLRDDFSDDPNQPLFILDGFETSLQNIVDLDMNRVASITILKDAGSTAIYGSRASNGVVVVETVRPKQGKVNLSYTSDILLEIADLRSYNMMNSLEKLEFEKLSGLYNAPIGQPELQDSYYDPLYSKRLQDALSGVDSYWLSEPLQLGFTHKHSLYAEGGSENLFFNAGGNYKNQRGVMIGSGREEWGGRLNLTYRNDKLNINNNLYVNGALATESPYGSFSTWVNTNPYYKKEDASNPYLEQIYDYSTYRTEKTINPSYNANLNSFDKTKTLGITNNLQLIYTFNRKLRLTSSLQLSNSTTERNAFKSPLHTDYLEVTDFLEKGSYVFRSRRDFSYTGSMMLTYANVFRQKHSITLNGRTEISNTDYLMKGFDAQGFPTASNGNPAFAYQYTENGSPYSTSSTQRRNSIIATANYTYDRRYSVDASFNYDGSTAFGQNNLYSPFYSIGASWNAKNERFLADEDWLSNLRLRINYGVNGNQNFSSTTSISTYTYSSNFNRNGQGVTITTLGNPDLEWQNTTNLNLGLDASFLNNRASMTVDVYRKFTDPQVVSIDLPLSTGLSQYPFNAGNLEVKGLEANFRFAPIYRPQDRFVWNITLMGSTYTQRYDDFDDKLSTLNQSLQESSSLTRYYDGADPADLWAVRSLGIDPASGREIFLKKDGTQTFEYSAEDIVKVGNSRPTIQGTFGTNLSYKGFTVSAIFRYIWDQDVLNSALFNKVENISRSSAITNNQDRRALYERWREPGDQAEFKSISLTTTTPISSRFVQQENTFSFESMSLGYQFRDQPWISRLGLSNLRFTGYTNDIARLSTVRRERGIDYPYAKSISFSITANFK